MPQLFQAPPQQNQQQPTQQGPNGPIHVTGGLNWPLILKILSGIFGSYQQRQNPNQPGQAPQLPPNIFNPPSP